MKIWRFFKIGLVIIWTYILFWYLLIGFDGLHNDFIPWSNNYALIYGNTVHEDGTPSKRLQARLLAWNYLYREWKVEKIIVSWGIGKEGFDEAQIMKKYLQNIGIKEDDIIVDSLWYTTRASSEISCETLPQAYGIVWVSQWFHIARVKLSLNQSWCKKIYGFSPRFFEIRDIYSFFRELPAYIKYTFYWLSAAKKYTKEH